MTRLPPPPKAPDLDRELAQGYLAACARWGQEPEMGLAMLEPAFDERETLVPAVRYRCS